MGGVCAVVCGSGVCQSSLVVGTCMRYCGSGVCQGGSETTAAQRFVALRLLEEALDPHTGWKGDPDVGDENAQKVEDLQVRSRGGH